MKTFKIPQRTLLNFLMTLEDHYLKVRRMCVYHILHYVYDSRVCKVINLDRGCMVISALSFIADWILVIIFNPLVAGMQKIKIRNLILSRLLIVEFVKKTIHLGAHYSERQGIMG